MNLYLDIETGPDPLSECPPFDSAEVKLGNLKDPEKIAAKLAEAEANHKEDWLERAALDPLTGQVLAVGIAFGDWKPEVWTDLSEADLLAKTISAIDVHLREERVIGYNIKRFDFPFLVRRCWINGINVPHRIFWETDTGQVKWHSYIVDIMQRWQLGQVEIKGQSLKAIAKRVLGKDKSDDGKNFAEVFAQDRERALEYCRNDIELTRELAKRMGVV